MKWKEYILKDNIKDMNAGDIARIALSKVELGDLISLLNMNYKNLTIEEQKYYKPLKDKVESPTVIKYSSDKFLASKRATEARTSNAKSNINEAKRFFEAKLKRGSIKKISYYMISQRSGSHINTVKKYITLDEINV